MKIYTKRGDSGTTSLYGGSTVSKAHPRIAAYGTVDELNSAIGVARCESLGATVDGALHRIQHQLFALGSQLAAVGAAAPPLSWATDESICHIEEVIDELDGQLAPLTQFILPAGVRASAALHLARTLCRRAERCVVELENAGEPVPPGAIVYLNRIGDLLFVMARFVNQEAGRVDEPWVKPTQ